jgi:hypothetical protein
MKLTRGKDHNVDSFVKSNQKCERYQSNKKERVDEITKGAEGRESREVER